MLTAIRIKLFFNFLCCFHTRVDWKDLSQDTVQYWHYLGLAVCSTHETFHACRSYKTVKIWTLYYWDLPEKSSPLTDPPRLPLFRNFMRLFYCFLLCDACMPGNTWWGLDVNVSLTETPTSLYGAPLIPFAEIVVCYTATWKPITERYTHCFQAFLLPLQITHLPGLESSRWFTAAHSGSNNVLQ